MHTTSSINSSTGNVVSMATNLATKSSLKMKKKKKKLIRKQNNMKIKTENLMEYATIVVREGI